MGGDPCFAFARLRLAARVERGDTIMGGDPCFAFARLRLAARVERGDTIMGGDPCFAFARLRLAARVERGGTSGSVGPCPSPSSAQPAPTGRARELRPEPTRGSHAPNRPLALLAPAVLRPVGVPVRAGRVRDRSP